MKEIYLDKTKSIQKRVENLLRLMTIDEKIDQMFTVGCESLEELLARVEKGEVKNISATFVFDQNYDVATYNKLQEYQIKNNRLKIPFILASENTHGVAVPTCTVFPTTGCIAATFDPTLARAFAKASATEARSIGISQVYAPNVDISWDARWGRVEENFGEDPFLSAQMGANVVKGFQSKGVCATVKHFIAYGLPESGLNLSPAHIGERDIREYMLEPFEACIKAGAWSIMPSYNEIDGLPVHASHYWTKDVLRDELGFDGLVITDYGASNMFYDFHCIIDSPVEAGKILCKNAVDMEACGYFGYNDQFRTLVKNKQYPIRYVDDCVRRILTLKFKLGLFDDPFATGDKRAMHSEKHRKIAREIAEKGIVLLKNDGVLPLPQNKKVAVIGPNGNVSQLGNYISYESVDGKGVAENSLSLYGALKGAGIDCAYALGSEFHKTNDDRIKEAVSLAKESDVVLLALGDNSKGGKNAGAQTADTGDALPELTVTSGEGYDLNKIELTDAQVRLFNAVKETGKKIVLILYGGRPHAITEQVKDCSAILFGFGAGELGNEAMCDILFGKVNPSGKLPISFPRSTGHIPCFYNFKPSARGRLYQRPGSLDDPGRDYVFDTPNALFPFGFGLSYTTFAYSSLEIERLGNRKCKVSVSVKNTGKTDGDEVVLLYVSAGKQEITPVVKKLRAFRRITLKAGETKRVSFLLSARDFSFVGIDMKRKISTGKNRITIENLVGEIEIK